MGSAFTIKMVFLFMKKWRRNIMRRMKRRKADTAPKANGIKHPISTLQCSELECEFHWSSFCSMRIKEPLNFRNQHFATSSDSEREYGRLRNQCRTGSFPK